MKNAKLMIHFIFIQRETNCATHKTQRFLLLLVFIWQARKGRVRRVLTFFWTRHGRLNCEIVYSVIILENDFCGASLQTGKMRAELGRP